MTEKKKVLVTGAGSGIGRATATRLRGDGWHVLATGHSPGEGVDLKLDVTDSADIAAARDWVAEQAPDGLQGVVHSAGIPVGGALEHVEPAELDRIFAVNVTGTVAVTQALLPQLRLASGRIVILGSLGGRVAFPFAAPYHATKFALEAIADCLRLELAPQGVGVALIEPSAIDTPIWAKARTQVEAQRQRLDDEGRAIYDERLASFQDELSSAERKGEEPEKVAAKIADALVGGGSRYPVGRGAGTLSLLRPLLPDSIFDRIVAKAL